jgi:hypothetical protein
MMPLVGYEYQDRWSRRLTSERLRNEWVRADFDCVLFLMLLCSVTPEGDLHTPGKARINESGPTLSKPSLAEMVSLTGAAHRKRFSRRESKVQIVGNQEGVANG